MKKTIYVPTREIIEIIKGNVEHRELTVDRIKWTHKRRKAWVKIGNKQRIEELTKTANCVINIECSICNGETPKKSDVTRVNRSISHLIGKGFEVYTESLIIPDNLKDEIPF